MIGVAVGDQGRARVLYRLPEQRRLGVGDMPSMLASVLLALVLFLGGLLVGRATFGRGTAVGTVNPPATTAATATTGQTAGAPATRAPARADAPVRDGWHSRPLGVGGAVLTGRALPCAGRP